MKRIGSIASRVAAVAAILAAIAPWARAVEPSTSLGNLSRQTWLMENGLPQNTIAALAQSSDGFIWLGTESGLVRFDGVSFAVFDRNTTPSLPGIDVQCILPTRDGALWIGTSEGLARWSDGAAKNYSTQDGLPSNDIRALTQNADGGLTVLTSVGSARQNGQRFAAVETGSTTSANSASATMANGDAVLASKTTIEIVRGKTVVAHFVVGKNLPGNRIQALLADREGSLWIGTSDGLARWADGKLQLFAASDALASAAVSQLLEDREGNIWIGTESDGLHVLRDQRFRVYDAREGLASDATTTVVEDRSGALWVGTQQNGVSILQRSANGVEKSRSLDAQHGLASDVILSLAAAPNGDVWIGTPDGLNRVRGQNVATFTSLDGLPDDFIRSLLVDTDGSLWIGTRHGLAHWTVTGTPQPGGPMKTYTHADGLGSDLVGAMARDAHGDLWIATLSGLSRLHGSTIANFTTQEGLPSNVVTALLPRPDGSLVIGTQDRGWTIWDGKRFLPGADASAQQLPVHAALADAAGRLWFATANGIALCSVSSNSSGCSSWNTFGTADGLRSRETATNSHPSAWRADDGHLWFATPRGLVEADPAHFAINTIPPQVAIERFQVDDLEQPFSAGRPDIRIKAGHVHFEFNYAGLSYVAPLKVRYRYRLEGFDRDWTEAGTRRAAYYTNIPPGRYTFHVQAANNDGVWSSSGAAMTFVLAPRFYQTIWFYALMALLVVLLIVWFLRRRILHAEREFRAVLGERSRIAREIHDTLAQGYVGISLQLEVLAELLRLQRLDQATRHLVKTQDFVREGLADARQSIWALRTQDANESNLPVKLRRLAEAADGEKLHADFSLFGAYRPLTPETEQEIFRIAQEAIHNVKKHADASQLWVRLEYAKDSVALEVRDNGRGGASERDETAAHGRFGLTGMKERAAAVGGKIEVDSTPGRGTAIRLLVPANFELNEQTEVMQ